MLDKDDHRNTLIISSLLPQTQDDNNEKIPIVTHCFINTNQAVLPAACQTKDVLLLYILMAKLLC